MASLQAAMDFVSPHDQPPATNMSDAHAVSAMLDMIDRDVLSFDLGLDQSSEDDVSSPDVTTLVANAPWPQVSSQPVKRRRRGVPRKDEIEQLKEAAAKLSAKLHSLKAAAAKSAAQNDVSNVVAATLWKDIASRQWVLRKESEESNANLRDDVMAQAKCASNLKRMLKRRYCEEMLEHMPLEKRGRKAFRKSSADNERVFQELLGGTDQVYIGVDALFAKKKMAQLPCPGRTHQAYPDAVNGLFFELQDKFRVPFNARKTADAVWKSVCGRKPRDGDIVGAKLCAQTTQQIKGDFTNHVQYTCNVTGHASYIQDRQVVRRYSEENRVVFVCRNLIEPSSRSRGALGLLFQESAVIVVREGQTLASGEETAVIESCVWVTRRDEGKEAALMFRKAVYMDLAIKGWNNKHDLYTERIENTLFDDAKMQLN